MLVEQDECWFSRFVQPHAHAWAPHKEPLRLQQRDAPYAEPQQALACFGALRHDTQQVLLYFSHGQPNSHQMWVFIIGLLAQAKTEGKRVLVILWDNASWQKSHAIRRWIRVYNHAAKGTNEPRLITHLLPSRSPWLNPIEPCWLHAKRAVCEPGAPLSSRQLRTRIAAYFQVTPFFDLSTPLL